MYLPVYHTLKIENSKNSRFISEFIVKFNYTVFLNSRADSALCPVKSELNPHLKIKSARLVTDEAPVAALVIKGRRQRQALALFKRSHVQLSSSSFTSLPSQYAARELSGRMCPAGQPAAQQRFPGSKYFFPKEMQALPNRDSPIFPKIFESQHQAHESQHQVQDTKRPRQQAPHSYPCSLELQ